MLKNDYFKVRENELKDTSVLVVDLTKKKLSDLRDKEATQLPISEAVSNFHARSQINARLPQYHT